VINLNCRDWKKRLPILLDEPPESRDRRALAEHLAICPSCSGEWALLAGLRQEARKLPELEPGSHVWEQIRERLYEEAESTVKEPWWRALIPAPMPKLGWALAPAAAVLLAVLIFHWRQPAQEVAQVTQPGTAQVATTKATTAKAAEVTSAPEAQPVILTRMPERSARIPRWSPDTIPLFVIETLEPQSQGVYVDARAPDTEQPVFVVRQGKLPEDNFIPSPSNYLTPVVSLRK
jgi:hypothetical protein